LLSLYLCDAALMGEDSKSSMARIEGVDPKQTSFLMRQMFKKVRDR